MIDIDQYLDEKRKKVNRALKKFRAQSGPAAVIDAMNYSLEAGGKRLRPILTLAVADTLGSEDDSIIDVACALELVHTYSLIHDDLPAMDDSDLRRGKPTCHKVYGEAIAVLAGDALLTLAFEVLGSYGRQEGYAGKAIKIIAELSGASGVRGMIGGQVLDLEAEGKELTRAEVEDISAKKTGALLRAAVICGAIAADASLEEQKILSAYASNIGTAFQITDDLLDLESSAEELGKPVGADRERFKPTYPAVIGPEEARREAEIFYQQSVASLRNLNQPAELLQELARKLVFRKK